MINIQEDFNTFSYEILLKAGEKISSSHLSPSLSIPFTEDKLAIIISIDEIDASRYPIQDINDLNKIYQLNESIDEDSTTKISFEIIKMNNKNLRIYNSDAFLLYLQSLNLQHLLDAFSKRFSQSKSIEMIFKNKDYKFSTFLFNPLNEKHEEKLKKIDIWNFSSNSQNILKYGFIPDDFIVVHYSKELFDYKVLFDKIAFILSVSFIADISTIDNDIFEYKIIGYKKIESALSFKTIVLNSENYFYNVYHWIFNTEQTNIEDKLGLARNIISRHIVSEANSLEINEECFSAIISSYKIYLKENVEKYIETKNKVAELSTELSVKSKEISTYVISSFKNNNLTLSTFFISLFVFNTLSNDSEAKIFTLEKYYLTMVILLISIIYLFITRIQVNAEVDAQKEYYISIKNIYKDIFDQKELDNLFSTNHLSSTNKFVNSSTNRFSYFWLIEVILLGLIAIYLTFFA